MTRKVPPSMRAPKREPSEQYVIELDHRTHFSLEVVYQAGRLAVAVVDQGTSEPVVTVSAAPDVAVAHGVSDWLTELLAERGAGREG